MAVALTVSVLSGCGGDPEGGGGVRTFEPTGEPTEYGRLIDSPVSGIHYVTASQSGTTDEDGRFAYRTGETVTFHLGDPAEGAGSSWRLGETTARAIVTPLELVNTEAIDDRVVNLLRLLQTLDDDLDPSNGIRIGLGQENLPDGSPELDFSLPTLQFATDPTVLGFVEHVVRRSGLVDAGVAVNHFQSNLNELLEDPTGGWVLSDGSIHGESIEGLEASLQFDGSGRYAALVRWPQGSVSVEADFEIEGLWLGSRILEADLHVESNPSWIRSWSADAPVELTSAPVPPPAHVLVATGAGTLIRILPNRLTLESADGGIVLHYVRGDPADGLSIAFIEVDPAVSELTSTGAELQLSAEAFTATSAGVPGTRFLWQSSDPSVATVDEDGTVVAIAEGSTTIVVSAAGVEVNVRIDVVVDDSVPNGNESGEPGVSTNDAEETTSCDEEGNTVSVNEERVSQVNRNDTSDTAVDQQNTSTVEQSDGDERCIPSTTPDVSAGAGVPDVDVPDVVEATAVADSSSVPDAPTCPTDAVDQPCPLCPVVAVDSPCPTCSTCQTCSGCTICTDCPSE